MHVQWIVLLSSLGQIFAGWIPERIVGGHSVAISSVPWQASLQRHGSHICGAATYSEWIVITAAHCVVGSDPSSLSVRVGSSSCHYGGKLVRVSAILAHEDYHHDYEKSNDVAVVRLESPLLWDRTVRPIPLASSSPAPGSSASVSGWGAVGWKWPMSSNLLSVTLDIVDQESCWIAYRGGITKAMLCAAAPGKDACTGDSGGPLVFGGQLVGIVSFGAECAHPDYPGVYADVAELRPWILEAIDTVLSGDQ